MRKINTELASFFFNHLKGSISIGTLDNYLIYINRLPFESVRSFEEALLLPEPLLKELNLFVQKQPKKSRAVCLSAIKDLLILFNQYNLTIQLRKYKQLQRRIRKKFLSFDDIRKIIDNARKIEDKLIIMLQYDAGCRISAVLAINYNDFDFGNNQLVIYEKKTQDFRTISLSNKTMDMLKKYLFIHQIKKGRIFHIKYSAVYKRQKILFARAGFPETTSHWFRGSRAVHLLQQTNDIEAICRACGFSPQTAFIYLRDSGMETKKLMEKYEPRW